MPKTSLVVSPSIALITGASRGLGAAYAKNLAGKGYDLLLLGRDESRLEELASTLRLRHEIQAHWALVDLSRPDASDALYHFAHQHCETPDLLINNAGFGMYGAFHTHPLADVKRMLYLHINTIVETIHRFLPTMIARGSGSIINVSSLAGFFPLPYMAEYAATKAFLVAFSEALAEEIRPFGIKIQVCCPGQIDTEFHSTAGFRPKGLSRILDPDEVVRASLRDLGKNHVAVPVGWSGHVATLLSKLAPRHVLARLAATRTRPPG